MFSKVSCDIPFAFFPPFCLWPVCCFSCCQPHICPCLLSLGSGDLWEMQHLKVPADCFSLVACLAAVSASPCFQMTSASQPEHFFSQGISPASAPALPSGSNFGKYNTSILRNSDSYLSSWWKEIPFCLAFGGKWVPYYPSLGKEEEKNCLISFWNHFLGAISGGNKTISFYSWQKKISRPVIIITNQFCIGFCIFLRKKSVEFISKMD